MFLAREIIMADQEYQQLQGNLDLTSRLLDETHRQMPLTRTTTAGQAQKTKLLSTASSTNPTKPVAVDHSYITRLPTFEQRGKAIAQRLDDVKKNPRYAALSDDMKAKVRAGLYKQLVPASYAGFHLPVPDEKTWVAGSGKDLNVAGKDIFTPKKQSDSFNDSRATQFGEDFYSGADKAYNNMTMFGAHIANEAFAGMYGLAQHFTSGPLNAPAAAAKPEQLFMASKNVAGLLKPGNININDRPMVKNGKNTSTVWSASFGTDNGTILLPRVSDGEDGKAPHLMSNHEAWDYYKKYGKSLGTFKDDASADAYGEALHEQQDKLGSKNGRTWAQPSATATQASQAPTNFAQKATQALRFAQRTAQNLEDAAHSRVQSDDYWLQTHPRDTMVGKLASSAGEMVATLPLYEALGVEGAGSKVLGAMKSAPITARLMATPAGKFVATRLINATGMYTAALAGSGGNTQEAKNMAIGDLALGTAFAAPGAIKVASAALAKKWTASVVAEGGIPFAQDIATSAAHELSPLDWWLKHGEEAGVPKYGPGSMQVGRDLAIIPHGEDEGHFVNTVNNQTYHYKGKQEQQLLFNHLTQEHLQVREQMDPVMAKLHEAEKTTLNSIALQKTGTFFEHLSDTQKLDVLGDRMEQIWGAAKEAPVHLPEQLHEQIDQSIKAERAADPQLHALMSQDEQMFGAKFADVYTENATEAVAKETGISNQRGAARAMAKNEASLSPGDDISPRKFASLGADSASYLRAPRDRSDVSFIGQRSKDAYDKTYQLLKQADGGFFRAERPVQRFLYHYADKGKLPAGLRQSVLHWIKETPGYSGKTEKEIFQEAKNLRVHMYDMAKSGRLKHEGNIFASTKTEGPMKWSPWQAPLSNESDQAAIKGAQKALAKHPEALRGFNATVKALQSKMLKAKTPEELQAFKDALDQASRAISTHVSRGSAKFGG